MVADQQHDDHDPFGAAASDPTTPIDAGDAFVDPVDPVDDVAVTPESAGVADEPDEPLLDDAEALDDDAPEVPSPEEVLDAEEVLDPEAEAAAQADLEAAQAELDAAAAREEQLTRLFTATIMGPGEERIGKVGQVYLDDQTQEPNWVTAKTGLFGTKEFFIPLDEAQLDGKHIVVPYTKADVTTAPVTEIDQNLSPDEEDALYNHYRVPGRMTIDPDEGGAEDETAADTPGDEAIDAPLASIESVIADAPADEGLDVTASADDPVTVAPHAPLAQPHATGGAPSPFAAPEPAAAEAAEEAPEAQPAPAVAEPEALDPASDAPSDVEDGDAEHDGPAEDDSQFRRPEF